MTPLHPQVRPARAGRRRRAAALALAIVLGAAVVQAAPSIADSGGHRDGVSRGDGGGSPILPGLPFNDFEKLWALNSAQLADMKPARLVPAPRLKAVPRAHCGLGSRPLRGMQGRVSGKAVASKAAKRGWTCNVRKVARSITPGGFRVWRYQDPHGHTCAFYDTSFFGGANAISLAAGPTLGVKVLDMARPSRPRVTATLLTPGMLAPHESLNLNAKRGLLGAATGNAATLPGTLDLYDVKTDCRHPRLLSITPIETGHESGFSKDGRTFWVGGGFGYIYAFDVSHPRKPKQVWKGAYYSHGINLSDDGRTMFHTDLVNGNLGILDVSQVQARKAEPHVHDRSRMTWGTVSIPQNTVPFTRGGHHYLLEFDEFAFRVNPLTVADSPGAARIIDIDDLKRPRIVSDLRLAANMRANHKKTAGDPSPLGTNTLLGNAFHYCAVDRERNPTIAACSAIGSGLRIFDIRNPRRPKEVGYFVAPPKLGRTLGLLPGNAAMSQPAFDAKRRQIWYTDASSGLWVLKLNRRAWPRR